MSHASEQFRRRTQHHDHPPPAGGRQPFGRNLSADRRNQRRTSDKHSETQ